MKKLKTFMKLLASLVVFTYLLYLYATKDMWMKTAIFKKSPDVKSCFVNATESGHMYREDDSPAQLRYFTEDALWTRNGPAEREQFKHFWEILGGRVPYKKNDKLNHKFSVELTGNGIRVYIEEYTSLDPTKVRSVGGSSFRIELLGNNYHVCPVRDFFNGSYIGFCPKIRSCVCGTIFLDYVHFSAFKHHHLRSTCYPERLHRTVGNFHVCPREQDAVTKLRESNDEICTGKSLKDYREGYWWADGDRWSMGTEDGCIFEFMTVQDLVNCYENKSTFTFLGDSHIRNTAHYLKQLFFNFLDILRAKGQKINLRLNFGKYGPFAWANYPHVIREEIARLARARFSDKTPATKNDVVLMNFGSWPLVYESYKSFLEKDIPKIIDFLASFRQNRSTSQLRMLYTNTLPRVCGNKDANDYMTAAINEILAEKLKPHRVEIIDGFNLLNPVKDHNVCQKVHYLCQPTNNQSTSEGHSGMTLAHFIFKTMCYS